MSRIIIAIIIALTFVAACDSNGCVYARDRNVHVQRHHRSHRVKRAPVPTHHWSAPKRNPHHNLGRRR